MNRRKLMALGVAGLASTAWANSKVFTGRFSNLGLSGYDPVGYFVSDQPVEGSAKHQAEWAGVDYRFANQANRDAFLADPERYLPAYGGFCAYAVANGYTASADPEAWTVVDGRLYLNYNKSVRTRWLKDVPGHIEKANQNWPGLAN